MTLTLDKLKELCPPQGPAGPVTEFIATSYIAIPMLIEEVERLREALEYYAKAELASGHNKLGVKLEFGCGCCAGVVGDDELIECDKSIIGQTAREALEASKERLP